MLKKSLIVSFIALLAGNAAVAQSDDIALKLSLDRDSMVVGDQVQLTLNVSYNNKVLAFSFPTVGDTLMPGIEVLHTSPIDTLSSAGSERTEVQRTYTLTSFNGGIAYTLPKFVFTIDRGTAVDTFTSNSPVLKVAFPPMYNTIVANDSGKADTTFVPNDIKPPVQYPITFVEAAPYVLGGLLLLALLAFAVYAINRKRHNKPIFFKPKPKEPAHIIALRDLQKLKEAQLWQQGQTKEFYTRISGIVRVYIEDRFGVPAMEQTSDEILSAFETLQVCSKDELEELREMFYTSDLVKFAKHTPSPDENENCFMHTQKFVEKTKQEVVTENEAK